MYDYNKPLKESDFDFISYEQSREKDVLRFSINGEYYRQIYKKGRGYGFKFIEKYPTKIAFEQGIFGTCQNIYSSTWDSQCTAEGRFIEFSLSKLNFKEITKNLLT